MQKPLIFQCFIGSCSPLCDRLLFRSGLYITKNSFNRLRFAAPHKRIILNVCARAAAYPIQTSSPNQWRSIGTTPSTFLGSDINSFRSREEQRDREQDTEPLDEPLDENAAKRERVEAVRNRILRAALDHVSELGWSREALEAGAASVQLPSIVHGLFPGGGFELVEYFSGECDRRMVEHLTEKAQQELLTKTTTPLNGDGIRGELAFVSAAIQHRLEMLEPLLAVWPQALGLRALPQNAPVALTQTMRMVDDICYHAGDRSVDVMIGS